MRFLFLLALLAFPSIVLAAPPAGQAPAPPVETTTVVRIPLVTSLSAIGSLSANEGVVVRPEIAGLIKEIPADEGMPVKVGQPLFVLDQDILSAEARRATSGASLGSANLQRAQALKQSGYGTQETLDAARSAAVSNKADATVAQVKLSKTIVRAPFDGIVGLRQVNLGDYVNIGQDLVNIEQIDPIKLDFTIPETYLASVQAGMPVTVTVDAYAGETFTGAIYAINPKIDPVTRTIAVRARIANPEGKLRPGLFTRVTVPLTSGVPTLVVPETTLVPNGSLMDAFKVVDGKAQHVSVKMGVRNNGLAEVLGGLNEGDVIIVTGQMRVQDGKPVNVVNTVAAPTAPVMPAAATSTTDSTGAASLQLQPDPPSPSGSGVASQPAAAE